MIAKEIIIGNRYLLSNLFDFTQLYIIILNFEKTSDYPNRLDLDSNYYECYKIFYRDLDNGLEGWDIVIKSENGFEYESLSENKEGYIILEEINEWQVLKDVEVWENCLNTEEEAYEKLEELKKYFPNSLLVVEMQVDRWSD